MKNTYYDMAECRESKAWRGKGRLDQLAVNEIKRQLFRAKKRYLVNEK